jgi:ABC-type xylose transport system permease subunit
MKKIKTTATELKTRWSGKTPTFWKKVQRIGVIAGAIGGVIVAAPIALPAALVTLSGYLLLAGSVTATLAQLTVEK